MANGIRYRRDGKLIEEKAGRQFQDAMTPARAAKLRAKRIDGDLPSNEERRSAVQAAKNAEREAKEAESARWTVARLWDEYCSMHTENKILGHEKRKFDLYLRDGIGSKEPVELLPLDVDRLRIKLQREGKRTTAARILEILVSSDWWTPRAAAISPSR